MTDMTTSLSSPVYVQQTGDIVFATLNRPEKRNALTDDIVAQLTSLCECIAADASVRGLVLRGAGGTFCAGGDFSGFQALMREPLAAGQDPIAVYNRKFGTLLERLATLSVPTIAVVEGAAIGGGCGLAAVCDRVLVADDASFATPEVTLGLPPAQIAPFIVARIGAKEARWLMLTGAQLSAGDALCLGLADEVATSSLLSALLVRELAQLKTAEPNAVRATKRIVVDAGLRGLPAVLDSAADAFAVALRSGKVKEGLTAFGQKRAAAWCTETLIPPDWQ